MPKEKIISRKCRFCPEIITAPSKEFSSAQKKHEWEKHRPEMEDQTRKAHEASTIKRQRETEKMQRQTEQGQRNTEGTETIKDKGDGHKAASSPEQANVFVVRSQKYEIGSMLLLIAKNICETEWNWPKLSVEDFLDTYFFETMRQRGFVMGAYQKLEEVQSESGT